MELPKVLSNYWLQQETNGEDKLKDQPFKSIQVNSEGAIQFCFGDCSISFFGTVYNIDNGQPITNLDLFKTIDTDCKIQGFRFIFGKDYFRLYISLSDGREFLLVPPLLTGMENYVIPDFNFNTPQGLISIFGNCAIMYNKSEYEFHRVHFQNKWEKYGKFMDFSRKLSAEKPNAVVILALNIDQRKFVCEDCIFLLHRDFSKQFSDHLIESKWEFNGIDTQEMPEKIKALFTAPIEYILNTYQV